MDFIVVVVVDFIVVVVVVDFIVVVVVVEGSVHINPLVNFQRGAYQSCFNLSFLTLPCLSMDNASVFLFSQSFCCK